MLGLLVKRLSYVASSTLFKPKGRAANENHTEAQNPPESRSISSKHVETQPQVLMCLHEPSYLQLVAPLEKPKDQIQTAWNPCGHPF